MGSDGDGTSPGAPRALVDRPHRGILALRLGLGILWSLNLIYILVPANRYWTGFAATAGSYAGATIGGGGPARFVADHPTVFALLIAGTTFYLAAAFLLGRTVRAACLIGGAFNIVLLVTQFAQISTFPGSTDVGAQPLYLAIYLALFLGYEQPQRSRSRWAVLSTLARRLRPWARPRAVLGVRVQGSTPVGVADTAAQSDRP